MIYSADGYNLDGLQEAVDLTVEKLRPRLADFDSIVVTGLSGVVVGAPVALALDKPLVILRKPTDNSHHSRYRRSDSLRVINEDRLGSRALFLDDFVAGGETRARVRRMVESSGAHLVAQFMYQDYDTPTYEPLDFSRPAQAEVLF